MSQSYMPCTYMQYQAKPVVCYFFHIITHKSLVIEHFMHVLSPELVS